MARPIVPILLIAAASLAAGCRDSGSAADSSSAQLLSSQAVADGAGGYAPAPPPVAAPTSPAAKMSYRPGEAREEAGSGAAAVDAALAVSAEMSPAMRLDARQAQAVPRSPDDVLAQPSAAEILDRAMVIRTGNASLEVHALDSAITRARLLAIRLGGYVGNTNVQGGKDQPRVATLEIKLPAPRFDEAIGGLAPIGKVEAVNVSAQDVSEEYVDVAARVANGRRLEEQLVRLLERRTGRLSDALEVERELARVREQIERYEGRMRWLRSRSAVSTLSLTMHEPMPLIAQHPGDSPIRDAFVQAWRNLVAFFAACIASLGVVIPLGLIGMLLWAAWRRWAPVIVPAPRTKPVDGEA
jgi:hypothetical protein